jgi:flagellin
MIMGLRIQNNVEAFNAHRQLTGTASKAAKAMEKLSSGYRVNRAADDAAGLAISEKMRAQIGGVAQAQRNAQDGVSLVQTAEGALSEVHSMLQRIRDLKVQGENDTLNSDDLGAIRKEIKALGAEIGSIQSQTKFNGISLLNGSGSTATVSFQVGANTGEQITADVSTISGLSAVAALTNASSDAAVDAIDIDGVETAITAVSTRRADLGAVQNRLEHRLNNLGAYQENLVASESRIRDVDMAKEMVEFSKLQILQQAGTAMLAQANQVPQSVLQLLR